MGTDGYVVAVSCTSESPRVGLMNSKSSLEVESFSEASPQGPGGSTHPCIVERLIHDQNHLECPALILGLISLSAGEPSGV